MNPNDVVNFHGHGQSTSFYFPRDLGEMGGVRNKWRRSWGNIYNSDGELIEMETVLSESLLERRCVWWSKYRKITVVDLRWMDRRSPDLDEWMMLMLENCRICGGTVSCVSGVMLVCLTVGVDETLFRLTGEFIPPIVHYKKQSWSRILLLLPYLCTRIGSFNRAVLLVCGPHLASFKDSSPDGLFRRINGRQMQGSGRKKHTESHVDYFSSTLATTIS